MAIESTATIPPLASDPMAVDSDDILPSEEMNGVQGSENDSPLPRFRLDYLFALDVKLWKKPRGELKELFINTMIKQGGECKRFLGIPF